MSKRRKEFKLMDIRLYSAVFIRSNLPYAQPFPNPPY